jgi:membrane protease YdiL (CAAX protease family)
MGAAVAKRRSLHPLLVLLLWLIAAFLVIWTGPMFVPNMNSTVRIEAVLWKMFGASLLLGASLYLLGREPRLGALGLRPSARTISWLLAGSITGALLVILWFVILRALVPFQFANGMISPFELALSVLVYFFGAVLEELAFRGYPLLRLRERYGSFKAIMLVSLAFGILHLPGMTGTNAAKIVAITGLSSVIFSIAYLRSRTLWTAVGAHMSMNVVLHSILGGGGGQGPSLLRTVFDQKTPLAFDPSFWSFVATALIVTAAMILLWPQCPFARAQCYS